MAIKRIAILDMDRCSSYYLDAAGISGMLADWIKSQKYDVILFCTHRRLRLHGQFMQMNKFNFHHSNQKNNADTILNNLLTCNIIKNFLAATDLTEKFAGVSTPDDRNMGYGQGYETRLKPYEESCIENYAKTGEFTFPDTLNSKINPEEDILFGEFDDQDDDDKLWKNEQLEQIFDAIQEKFSSTDFLIYDYIDDNDECLDSAKKLVARNNSELNIYRHYSSLQSKGVELLHTVHEIITTSTANITKAMKISLRKVSDDENNHISANTNFEYDQRELQTVDLASGASTSSEIDLVSSQLQTVDLGSDAPAASTPSSAMITTSFTLP